jgi:hypothetical protein
MLKKEDKKRALRTARRSIELELGTRIPLTKIYRNRKKYYRKVKHKKVE